MQLVVRVNDRQTGRKLAAGPNMQIRLRRADRPGVSEATEADEHGNFMILVPPADYSVEISIPGYKKWHYHGAESTATAKAQRGSPPRKKEIAPSLDHDQ